ncbi:MAG: TetR/AcrR family transcriptional regulator [Opitutaceae bacterium]|jgi:AcrR family transcriptional regulator|nr:TetR/AcrR family transcriptional regulator [Opitutaceae bacterium]
MKPRKNKRESNSQGLRKRLSLLKAAGRVFAKKGYVGTSIRDIAGMARAHSSVLIYHFGSKERLFLETLRHHIIDNARLDRLFDVFLDADPQNPQTLSDALLASVRNIMRATHGPTGRVQNLDGLLVRMLVETDLKVNRVIQEMGDRVMAVAFEKLLAWNPGLTRTDIYWWSHMFWALLLHDNRAAAPALGERRARLHGGFSGLDVVAHHAAMLPVAGPPPARRPGRLAAQGLRISRRQDSRKALRRRSRWFPPPPSRATERLPGC